MLIFKKIRYQNILSTGNQFTEIDFLKDKTTLIIGENGAGKSTLLDALFFCLYGKPFRDINKPLLLNSITKKNLLVEVEFSCGTQEYLVKRGMKPNIFEIYQNGNMIDQPDSVAEYQSTLENIIKMNSKSFSQIVILGSADYTPFMKLSAADRRTVIEDLLDLQVFTAMNSIHKQKIIDNKNNIKDVDHDLDIVNNSIDLYNKNIEEMKQNNEELIAEKNKKISELEDSIVKTNTVIQEHNNKIEDLNKTIQDHSSVIKKKDKLSTVENELTTEKNKSKKELMFYENNDSCPTCQQNITVEFKSQKKEKHIKRLDNINETLTKLNDQYTILENRLKEINTVVSEISEISTKTNGLLGDIRVFQMSISTYKKDIEDLLNRTETINTNEEELKDLIKKRDDLQYKRKDLNEEKEILAVSSLFLKDTGAKAKMIRKYVPIINETVNKYLSALDFFVAFELDELFNETIKSRYRDEFKYASFSEGEKFRIDISLMFTWRAIAKKRNSAATNLLIMDEVFDGSSDQSGVDYLSEILDRLDSNSNIFIISHSDKMIDRLDNVIKFEKHKNFSRIAEQ